MFAPGSRFGRLYQYTNRPRPLPGEDAMTWFRYAILATALIPLMVDGRRRTRPHGPERLPRPGPRPGQGVDRRWQGQGGMGVPRPERRP